MSSLEEKLQGCVLGIGNPLLDISAECPMTFIEKYELQLNNAILAEQKHMALYDELVTSFDVQYIAGGATQNSIRVAQWMFRTPGCTGYMGAVGDDANGKILADCCARDGVNVHYMKNPEVPTGTCAVLINGGERSLVANLGAANTFHISHLESDVSKDLIEKARIYYIAGFFLTVSVESALFVGKHAAEHNKLFCLNLSAPFICQFFGEQLSSVLPYVDYLFCNESEALAYSTAKGYGEDLEQIALKIAAQPKACGTHPRVVVITNGAQATIVARNGVVNLYSVDPLPKELLIDTNGAGDAFVGGFLSRLALNSDIAECVRAAHFASRTIIQRSGCTFPADCEYV